MDLDLAGARVLVTGGSKGIGLAIARAFAAEGARVTLVARSAEALEAARSSITAACDTHVADLSVEAEREALFASLPAVDILVNNAGAIKGGRLADLSIA